MSDDIASAARRLADLASTHGERDGYPHMRDLRTLLPILKALAVGQEDVGRVDRWRDLVRQHVPDRWGASLDDFARAAMALADAERAARVAEGWKAYEEARDGLEDAAYSWAGHNLGESFEGYGSEEDTDAARTALDDAVRRFAGVMGAVD